MYLRKKFYGRYYVRQTWKKKYRERGERGGGGKRRLGGEEREERTGRGNLINP